MTLHKAIKLLQEKFFWAREQRWIRKPMAWALYEVWKMADREEER